STVLALCECRKVLGITGCQPVHLASLPRCRVHSRGGGSRRLPASYRQLQAPAIARCFPETDTLSLDVHRMRLRNPKPVRQLAIIYAVENREVSKLASLQ